MTDLLRISRALRRRIKDESGVAMIVAMGTMMVILLLTAVVVDASNQIGIISNTHTNQKRAFEAAEAGLQETLYRLNSEGLTQATTPPQCIGGTLDSTQAPDSSLQGNYCTGYTEDLGNGAKFTSWTTAIFAGPGTCTGVTVGTSSNVIERCITSQGVVNGVARRVQIRVASNAATPVFPVAGLTGYNGVSIAPNAVINGTEASNYNINLQNNATSTGTTIGPSGSVTVSNGASPCTDSNSTPPLYGCVSQRTPQQGPFVPAQIAFPTSPATLDGNTRLTAPALDTLQGGATYDPTTRSLNLPNWASVTLGGGTYDFCNITMGNNTSIVLGPGVNATIYLDSPNDTGANPRCTSDSFSMGTNAKFINNSPPISGAPASALHDSTKLKLFVYDLPVFQMNNNGDFYGTIYAPNSTVNIQNNGAFYGSVAGKTINYLNNAIFYADNNDLGIGTVGTGLFYRSGWHECQPQPTVANDPGSGC